MAQDPPATGGQQDARLPGCQAAAELLRLVRGSIGATADAIGGDRLRRWTARHTPQTTLYCKQTGDQRRVR